MPKKNKFSYHLSVATKKLIIALCDEMPKASNPEKAAYVSSKIGRTVTKTTIRSLTKINRDKILMGSSAVRRWTIWKKFLVKTET